MRLADVMSTMTLRTMATADQLWREHVGPDGPKLQQAFAEQNFEAIAAMVAARMRMNGQPDATIDDALDAELDMSDSPGEAPSANDGDTPQASLARGT